MTTTSFLMILSLSLVGCACPDGMVFNGSECVVDTATSCAADAVVVPVDAVAIPTPELTLCDGAMVDLQTSLFNCGACRKACDVMQGTPSAPIPYASATCIAGTCGLVCDSGRHEVVVGGYGGHISCEPN